MAERPPFERTVCGCRDCVQCCHEQPGYLVPGDLERIAEHLGQTVEEAQAQFWNSPGALVMDTSTGHQRRIRTITPKFIRRKRACVFLDEQNRCRIHEVAPFGCAHFDTHQSGHEGQKRSVWGLRQIDADEDYRKTRESLMVATHYKGRSY